MLAVLLDSSHGPLAYGPFAEEDREVAERFARFLTAEVDPARVVPADDVLAAGTAWGSAMKELLGWYAHSQGGGDG